MSDLSVAVVSRSRPFGSTFKYLQKVTYPVFVYVHRPELELYKEVHPEHWTIVPHDFNTIGAIRNFVHEHQAGMNNRVLILDDDITAFTSTETKFFVTVTEILNSISDTEADCISFYHAPEAPSAVKMTWLGWAYVMFPHTTDIKMECGKYFCEDASCFVDFVLADKKIVHLPFYIDAKFKGNGSHFNDTWRTVSRANLYLKYGDIFETDYCAATGLLTVSHIQEPEIIRSRKNNFRYTKKGHQAILDYITAQKKFYGGMCENTVKELEAIYDKLPPIETLGG